MRLNRFLFQMRNDGELRTRYLKDPENVLGVSGLTEDERQAVAARDQGRLVALGAHPMLAILFLIFTDLDLNPEKYQLY